MLRKLQHLGAFVFALCLSAALAAQSLGELGEYFRQARPVVQSVPLSSPGNLYPCLASEGCQFECHVEGGLWTCTEADGTAITVTDAAGNGTETCFGVRDCMTDLDGSTAESPSIAVGDIPSSVDLTAPFTAVIVTMARTDDHATAGRHIEVGQHGVNGFTMYGATTCGWSDSGGQDTVAAGSSSAINGVAVFSFRQTSDTSHWCRINGNQTEDVANRQADDPTTYGFHFGDRGLDNNRSSRGIALQYVHFGESKADAFMGNLEAVVYGDAAATETTFARNSFTSCEQADGQIMSLPQDAPCVSAAGFAGFVGVTNYADEMFTQDSWTKSEAGGAGEPAVVEANSASGKLDAYNNGNDAALVTDSTASAEYIETPTAGTAEDDYVFSCWAKAGTSTTMRLHIQVAGGTGSGNDDHTVDSTWQRYYTTVTAGDTPTAVRGRMYPTDGVGASTGSVEIAGCQLETGTVPSRLCITDGSGAVTCAADTMLADNTGLPTVQGSVSFIYTPDLADPEHGSGLTTTLIDTGPDGASSEGLFIRITATGAIAARVYDGAATETATSGTLTWTPGTAYLIEFVWSPSALLLYRDGVLIASDVSVTAVLTGHTGSTYGICNRDNLDRQCNGSIKHLMWRQ